MAADGSFVVAWCGPGTWDNNVFARRFDAAGNPLDATPFQVNSTANGPQWNPAIGIAADGSFVVAWADPYNDSIAAQRYAADGSAVGGELTLNVATTGGVNIYSTRLAVNPDGSFAAGWIVTDYSTYMNFVVRTFTADGSPASREQVVASGFWIPAIDVRLAADGSILATWETNDSWGDGIYARVRAARRGPGAATLPCRWIGSAIKYTSHRPR